MMKVRRKQNDEDERNVKKIGYCDDQKLKKFVIKPNCQEMLDKCELKTRIL